MIKYLPKINVKNFNVFTVISLLALIAGIAFYLYWVGRYPNAWGDIGIYSITVVLVIPGIIGTILSLMEKSED
jgi:hypothetical protein